MKRYIFIRNSIGPPNHWTTGFWMNGKLYVMDYGAGPKWSAMQGVHGPYNTLDDYMQFLKTLSVPGFSPSSVDWRDFPGQED